MKNTTVLIIEDESIVAMEIESYLHKLGYNILDICSNATDAIEVATHHTLDIILVDICIKGEFDGIETATRIKALQPLIEILFLTAHLDDYNVDRAITLNPTAYLSKPFNREELRIALKIAQHKRSLQTRTHPSSHIIFDREFSYDLDNHSLYCCGEMIHLTQKETQLLELLVLHKNNIVDFYTIENSIWPEKDAHTNTIRTLVRRVREKLNYKFIETLSSRGYRLVIGK